MITLYFLVGIGLPGLAIRARLRRRLSFSDDPGGVAIVALALGTVWSTVQFLILYSLARVADTPAWGLLFLKHGLDAACIWWCGRREPDSRNKLMPTVARILSRFLQRDNLIGLLAASSFAVFAALQFPFGSDNAALYWISDAVMFSGLSFEHAQGSPGYISWLFWPVLLVAPGLQAGTLAAGSKLVLNWVAYFSLKHICKSIPGLSGSWAPPLMYLMVIFTMFGDYGLLNSAKETPFAILFMFAGMASLMALPVPPAKSGKAMEIGAWFSLAFGFGAITIPYSAVFIGLYFLFQRTAQAAKLLLSIGLWCSVALAFSLSTMLHQPLWAAFIATAALLAILYVAQSRLNTLLARYHGWIEKFRFTFCTLLLIGFIAGCWLLLPAEFERRPLSPLDGKTSFATVFIHTYWAAPPYFGALAFVGMAAALAFYRGQAWLPGLTALMAFPFAALLPSLAVAHLGDIPLPFHPQHLWDLAKDVPNWCWGPLSVLFVLLGVVCFAKLIAQRVPGSQRWYPVSLGVLICLLISAYAVHLGNHGRGAAFLRWHQGAYFTSSGGHRDLDSALYAEAIAGILAPHWNLFQERSPLPLFLRTANPEKNPFYDLHGCHVRRISEPLGANLAPLIQHAASEGFIIASRGWVEAAGAASNVPLTLVQLVPAGYGEGDVSLFHYRKTPEIPFTFTPKLPRPFPYGPPTFLQTLGLRPRFSWTDFASATPRVKDGDPLIWGKPKGTIWIELSESMSSGAAMRLSVRFMGSGREDARLSISSPLLEEPVELNQARRVLKTNIVIRPDQLVHDTSGGDWAPLHFEYHGTLEYHPTLGYMKSYYLDELSISKVQYLK